MWVENVMELKLYIFFLFVGQCNGSSVVICLGGGYWIFVIDYEGYVVVCWFNERGIIVFVFKYCLFNDEVMDEKVIVFFLDVQ